MRERGNMKGSMTAARRSNAFVYVFYFGDCPQGRARR